MTIFDWPSESSGSIINFEFGSKKTPTRVNLSDLLWKATLRIFGRESTFYSKERKNPRFLLIQMTQVKPQFHQKNHVMTHKGIKIFDFTLSLQFKRPCHAKVDEKVIFPKINFEISVKVKKLEFSLESEMQWCAKPSQEWETFLYIP